MKKIHDISIPVKQGMILWPNDPGIKIERSKKIENGSSSNVTELSMGLHTGTHIDAPYHFVDKGIKIEDITLDTFIGSVQVIEIPDSYGSISADVIKQFGPGISHERVLFRTRNSKSWNDSPEFIEDYVAVDLEGSEYLINSGVKLVGIDYLSIAPFDDIVRVHQALLKAGIVIIEGLNLNTIHAGTFMMYCLPLKLVGVEAAPARVILVEG